MQWVHSFAAAAAVHVAVACVHGAEGIKVLAGSCMPRASSACSLEICSTQHLAMSVTDCLEQLLSSNGGGVLARTR
jgi:hypothetical protein